MLLKNAGLKRKFLITTIAGVILVTILGSAVVYGLLQIDPGRAALYLLGVTFFYIAIGVSGILFITRLMVQPVLSLTAKVEEVRRGNLDVEIDASALRDSNDEMNQLIAGFGQMVRDLRHTIEALQHAKEKAEEYSEKLAQSHRRLQAIFDGLPDGVMIVDRHFRIVHVNPVIEKLMGKSLAQVRGEHCFAMCQGMPQRCSFCRADTVFQLGGRASTFCTKPAFGGQEDRMLEIYDFPLYNEKGEIDQVIEYVKDVTQAVKMQENLERTQRLAEIGNMAAIVAHEVRNPLNAIRGAVHYLKGECHDENLCSYLKLIEEQVQRVSKVTANLLDFAKPLVIEFQQGTITPVIEQALAQVDRLLKKKHIHLQKEIEAGLPRFPLDPAQAERAVVNLLTNAIQALPTGGHLHVCAYRPVLDSGDLAEEIEVVIADDGPGLGNRDPEEFFKPFFTTKLRGTGLGLFIVRKIMESHQGKVRLESNPGGGTRAVLTFPTRLKVYETETHHFGYR
ncbi:MAG: ATP-binding protein [candidate division KSB1 bacterium]|nr:ATP-binding protein [candidate division KSB1 bacterium]MDZ7274095.1 ATP-binding protein [candidate division KSB1 bacterium]MDZ7287860.1 ATP-binding protein [candidate division KSB1 bacterium]MDZ7296694.1 ATP-binding protein [candidate division KSB1 bacterium]MDZ7306936.1 ATP-binding protein [candidate division KSB1 bacterium]